MAVYTEVSDEALQRFVASYDLGRILSFKGIAEGVENTNFLLRTERGPYFLTLYEKRVARGDLPFFLGLMEHLAAHGINCPLPVRDAQGRILRELAHRPAALVTFLDGVSVKKPLARHCGSVGAALARLHAAADGFILKRPNALSVMGWRPLWDKFRDDAENICEGLTTLIDDELAFLERHWPGNTVVPDHKRGLDQTVAAPAHQSLPQGVIHADLFPDNVFFLDHDVTGIFDFYFACNDALVYDVAICLNAWCFEPHGDFNITKARALLRGYDRTRRLTPGELDALPILARGAALRFLLTRGHDWLNTPENALVRPKDPMEYVRKLRFHQGVRSTADYGLTGV